MTFPPGSPMKPNARGECFPWRALVPLSVLLAGVHAAGWSRLDTGLNVAVFLSHLFVLWVGGYYWYSLSPGSFVGFVATMAGMFFLLVAFKGQPLFYAAFLPLVAAAYRHRFVFGLVVMLVLCLALATPYWFQTFALLVLVYLAGAHLARVHASRAAWGLFALGAPLLMFLAFPVVTTILEVAPQTLCERFARPTTLAALWTSLWTATTATAVAAVLGVPLAYVLSRASFRGRAVVDSLIDLPILIPQTVVGIALMNCLGPKAALGGWLESTLGVRVAGTAWGIVLAQLLVAAPFMVRSSAVGFSGVDVRLERAARSLGASSWAVLARISLPLAWPAIVAGALMTWARAISEFGALLILAYRPATASVLVYDQLTQYGLEEARPAAALIMILCLWLFLVARWVAWLRGKRGAGLLGTALLGGGS